MRFFTSFVFFLVFVVLSVSAFPERDSIIAKVNSASKGWIAGVNSRFGDANNYNAVKRLLGYRKNPNRKLSVVSDALPAAQIPASFDSRQQWSSCKTIKEIRDQSDCGSCWAFGAVEAASDRICIATNGQKQPHLAVTDLLSCCTQCGMGCGGGDPGMAWEYLTQPGVVTGGNYGDYSWCVAYPLPNCEHHVNATRFPNCASLNGGNEYNTPNCPTACDANSTYPIPYSQDKHVFATAYNVNSSVAAIQTEIMTNGPVEAAFTVYADFEAYKGGVYQHVTGAELGGHAVKILGWGTDSASGLDYWLVANSWNTDWGEKGFFRIRRGVDECGIEDDIVAGLYTQ